MLPYVTDVLNALYYLNLSFHCYYLLDYVVVFSKNVNVKKKRKKIETVMMHGNDSSLTSST